MKVRLLVVVMLLSLVVTNATFVAASKSLPPDIGSPEWAEVRHWQYINGQWAVVLPEGNVYPVTPKGDTPLGDMLATLKQDPPTYEFTQRQAMDAITNDAFNAVMDPHGVGGAGR